MCWVYTDGETENTNCIRKQFNNSIHASCTITGTTVITISAIFHSLNQQKHLQILAHKSRLSQDHSVSRSSTFILYLSVFSPKSDLFSYLSEISLSNIPLSVTNEKKACWPHVSFLCLELLNSLNNANTAFLHSSLHGQRHRL